MVAGTTTTQQCHTAAYSAVTSINNKLRTSKDVKKKKKKKMEKKS